MVLSDEITESFSKVAILRYAVTAGRCRPLSIAAGAESGPGTEPALCTAGQDPTRRTHMLWTLFVVLLILWALGMVSSYTLGGFIHILLVIAVVVVLIRIIQGRRPV